MEIADDLDDDTFINVLAHETAHGIDLNALPPWDRAQFDARKWGIRRNDPDIHLELQTIYRDLNNPPGEPPTIILPRDKGYPRRDEARELWAEAYRAYMADPNYMKTVAPRTAAVIREVVAANPRLRRIIHFNSLGTAAGAAGAAMEEEEPE